MILGVKGSPARPDPTTEGIEIPIRIRFPNEEGAEPAEWRKPREESGPRGIHLKKEDFERHGYSNECKGCRWMQSGIGRRTTGHGAPAHSFLCRQRLEAALREERNPRAQGAG